VLTIAPRLSIRCGAAARAGIRRAGVVDQHIQASKLSDRNGHHGARTLHVRHIAWRDDDIKALTHQPLYLLRPALVIGQMIERHFGATASKQFNRCQTDP
jgi:hypothetical protein